MSRGEDIISSILRSVNISYEREYFFPDLKHNGNLLRFDFALLDGGRAITLIEYDSEIHFQRVSHFHKTNSEFKQAQERDRIKNKYCLLHNIPLIRIPYWEIEDLTYEKIFNTPSYYVSSKFHNDLLLPPN